MRKIAIILIVLTGLVSGLKAKEISGKKILKTAKKMVAKGQTREAVSMITRNIDHAGSYASKVFLKLGALQREILLLDSAFIALNEANKTDNPEIKTLVELELEMLTKQKEKYDFNVNLGNWYLNKKEFATARMSYSEALKNDTGNYEVWFGLSEIAEVIESTDEGLRMYQLTAGKYVEKPSELAHVMEHIAEIYVIKGMYSEAVKVADSAIVIYPLAFDVYHVKAKALFYMRDYSEASKSIVVYLSNIDTNQYAWNLSGDCYYYQKRYSSAIVQYNNVIHLDSTMTDTYSMRGKSYYFTQQYTLARSDFEYLNTLFESNYFATNAMGLCSYKMEDYALATSYFEQTIAKSSQDYYKFNLAMAYYMNDQLELALTYFDQLAQNHRYEPNYNVAKTWVLLKLNEPAKAERWINDSIKENPYIKDYYAVRALVYGKLGETKKEEKDKRIAYTIEGEPLTFELKF